MNRTRPLHILNVAETIKGGIATYLDMLEHFSGDFNCNFEYLIPAAQADQIASKRIQPHAYSRKGLGPLLLAAAIVRHARQRKPDVVYAHSTFAGVALCLAKPWLSRNTKTVYCAHGWASFRDRSKLVIGLSRIIERCMSYIPDAVVNISRHEHEINRKHGFSRKNVLIQSTVLDRTCPRETQLQSGEQLHILFAARLDWEKGYDILVEAIHILQKSKPDFVYHIVGDAVLGNLKIEKIVAGNVHYYGWVDHALIDSFYDRANVFIVPSRNEGFGLTVLEAFRSAVPVIASDRGALPEIVEHAVNGLVFNCTAADLAQKLHDLDLPTLRRYGDAARHAYQEKFAPARFVASYQNLFEKLRTTI
ncbi:Glycosyltransferase [Collimonas arenae]|uniref:Glycosyltransferase n=1 Tax=Collimonas arenae TaxID=279058 RepID=A0A0A1FG45_9BURK|nr:glycosyltransferase [Collimonas arenae]AIY41797.1 Glycosyltransferase [Collimonas arenae]